MSWWWSEAGLAGEQMTHLPRSSKQADVESPLLLHASHMHSLALNPFTADFFFDDHPRMH